MERMSSFTAVSCMFCLTVYIASVTTAFSERHLGASDVDQPGIVDGGSMCVVGEIDERARVPAPEGRLGVDDKRVLAKPAKKLGERGGVGERGAEFAACAGGLQAGEKQPPEDLRQRANRAARINRVDGRQLIWERPK